jgi:simple sugar transport system permease protein
MTESTKKQPRVRIVKRSEKSPRQILALRLFAVLLSLVAGGVFVAALGHNPLVVYGTIINGALRSKMAIQATVKIAVPLVIASLAVTFAFTMRFWNIGAEGQIIMGAAFASYFALFHSGLNHWLLLFVMFVAGAVGGGLWGLIPAIFKVRFTTNETLFTLMLNYIALHIVSYLRDGPWRDPGAAGFSKIARFDKNAVLDKVFGVHAGWIIALVLTFLAYVYLRRTKQGYEISVVGDSQETARYAGMNVQAIVLRTMFLSGAVAGICGMIQISGADITLTPSVAGGVGFTAIIIAWLSQLNPPVILVVSGMFSILEKGSSVLQSSYGLSTDSADVLQGIILFFILGCEFFVRYGFALRKKGG